MDWDLYEKRLLINGATRRERIINQTRDQIIRQSAGSPALKTVLVNGVEMQVFITSTKEASRKNFNTLPGEKINMGALIVWNEMHWLVISVDFDDEITCSGTIVQCNRIIRWQNTQTLEIIERWCFCSKPYTSNIDEGNIVSSLKGKYDIQLPYDSETIQVGVDKRLMLDIVGGNPMVYKLTFPDINTNKYQDIEGGFIEWTVVSDTYVEGRDNVELMICDYIAPDTISAPPIPPSGSLLKCEIIGRDSIRIGGSCRNYSAKFYESDGITEAKNGITPVWELIPPVGHEAYYKLSLSNGNFIASVSAEFNDGLIGDIITLRVRDGMKQYQDAEMRIEVSY